MMETDDCSGDADWEHDSMALDLVGEGMSSAFNSVIRGWLPASLPEHRTVWKGMGTLSSLSKVES